MRHKVVATGLASFLLGVALFGVACDPAPASSDPTVDVPSTSPTTGPKPPGDAGPLIIDAGVFTINATKPAFQTKSAAQLYSTLINCLGAGAGDVSADMFIGQPQGFLPVGSFNVTTQSGTDDIIAQQKKRFDGDPQSLASGVRNDELSLEYVTAQRNVANVAGKRCMSASPPANCACGTMSDAIAMITRCVPQLTSADPNVVNAAQTLSTACAANKGTAIASFIASTAFAKLP